MSNNNPSDVITYVPMTDAAVKAAELIAKHRPAGTTENGIGIMVADAGYLSAENLTAPSPPLALTGSSRSARLTRWNSRPAPTPSKDHHGHRGQHGSTPRTTWGHRLRTPEGIATYRQRSHIAETTFGHGKHNLEFRRFTCRGLIRTAAEWKFHGAVHNLLKAISTGHLAPASHPVTG